MKKIFLHQHFSFVFFFLDIRTRDSQFIEKRILFFFFFHVLFPLSFCPVSVGPDSVFRTGPLQPIGGFTDQLSHSRGIL